MKLSLFSILLFVFGIFSIVSTQEIISEKAPAEKEETPKPENSGNKALNVVESLQYAVEKNLEIKTVNIDVQSANLDLSAAYAPFEWNLSTATTYTSLPDKISQNVAVSKKFVTGTSVSLSTTASDQSKGGNDVSTSTDFSITQNLLAGATKLENEISVFRIYVRTEQEKNKFTDKIRQILFRASRDYFNYIKNTETIKVNQNALDQSKQFQERVSKFQKAGLATKLDVDTAEVQISSREEALLRSKTRIENSLDELKKTLGISMEDEVNFSREINLDVILPELNYEKSYAVAITNRPDYLNLILSMELLKRELIVDRREKKPNLSLVYTVGFDESDESLDKAYQYGDHPDHSLSLRFSMPLKRKQKITNYLKTELAFQKMELQLEDKREDIKKTIRRVLREIDENIKQIEVQEKRVAIEKSRVESFNIRFENGLVDSLEVTRAYDDFDRAKIDLINSKLNLKILIADYHVTIASDPRVIFNNEMELSKKK